MPAGHDHCTQSMEVDKKPQPDLTASTLWSSMKPALKMPAQGAGGQIRSGLQRLGSDAQYTGFGFSHASSDIAAVPKNSAYKTLETMIDKMDANWSWPLDPGRGRAGRG